MSQLPGNNAPPPAAGGAQLADRDFRKFSVFIYETCGIKMPPAKKTMLAARLQKRLRHLHMDSFSVYLDYVLSPTGQSEELSHLIDAVSTNKTDFFREAKHFDILTAVVLPAYLKRQRRDSSTLHVWSAGCSSGEEPYTLAMVLDDFFSRHPGHTYAILATDICTQVLDKAREAIYADDCIRPVPALFKQRYLMRGKGSHQGFHRVVPELRGKVKFRRLNFMDRDFQIKEKMDIIFCRNVIIYFDRITQETLFQKFHHQLAPHGYLFTGHSESLIGINDKMQRINSAVYQCLP
jgi:chemotaxis protein methyltransferase CheR